MAWMSAVSPPLPTGSEPGTSISDSSVGSSLSQLRAELLNSKGPHLIAHDMVLKDNALGIEEFLRRNIDLAEAFAHAKDHHERTAFQVASKRCKAIFMKYKMPDVSDNLPFVNDLPKTVSLPNYVAAVHLALKYALAGVEGHLHGHTLVLGDADTLLSLGTPNKFDPFAARRGDIKNQEDFEEIRRCLDADGMTLIDGTSGAPVANKFFSSGTSSAISGGARSKSALWMAEQAEAIVIKVSEDSKGEIVLHRGKGQGEPPCTAEYQKPNTVASAHRISPREMRDTPVNPFRNPFRVSKKKNAEVFQAPDVEDVSLSLKNVLCCKCGDRPK